MQYDNLSEIYDKFNDDFDYHNYFERIKISFDVPLSGLALDCGCGTGSLMLELLKQGYECTGVDLSTNMLEIAEYKIERAGYSPHLICQNLSEIDLYGAYDLVICSLDTVNHIIQKRDLKNFFIRLYNFIEYNGVFIFDIKTKAAFEKSKGTRVYENKDDCLIIKADFTGKYASYDFTGFKKTGEKYDKLADFIEERYYDGREIRSLLSQAGLVSAGRLSYKDRTIFAAKKIQKN